MHILLRERHGLEETAAAEDLGQAAADLVVLSFSDSDLGAFAAAWRSGRETLPSLRLANLRRLAHPLSVDLYIQKTLSGARGILIRLLGGVEYWRYGVEQVSALAAAKGIALAIVPGDGRPDPRLDAASNLPPSTLRRLKTLCDSGGPDSARAAAKQSAEQKGAQGWRFEVAPRCSATVSMFRGPGSSSPVISTSPVARRSYWWCSIGPFSPPPTPIRSTG